MFVMTVKIYISCIMCEMNIIGLSRPPPPFHLQKSIVTYGDNVGVPLARPTRRGSVNSIGRKVIQNVHEFQGCVNLTVLTKKGFYSDQQKLKTQGLPGALPSPPIARSLHGVLPVKARCFREIDVITSKRLKPRWSMLACLLTPYTL